MARAGFGHLTPNSLPPLPPPPPAPTLQGLAFGVMAGLPAVYGLYAATVAGYVYAIFGTSGQLTIGAVVLVGTASLGAGGGGTGRAVS